jgi:hypothetical protein
MHRGLRARHQINPSLTKVKQIARGQEGRVSRHFSPAPSEVFVMSLDPEEYVILTDHGPMRLHAAVTRAMILPPEERHLASIVRNGEPGMLNYDVIRHIAHKWERNPYRLNDSDLTGAFSLAHVSL